MADETPGLDLDALRGYLDRVGSTALTGPLRAEVIAGGRSNLTYIVTDGEREVVLRRPPLGHVLATAHDMGREHRLMSALADSPVPVPRMELFCEDTDVLGAEFFIMEKAEGVAMRSRADAEWLTPEQATAVSERLIDVLADLHQVDPAAVGLGDLGKPDGYLQRQVDRWGKQLESSRSRDLPGVDELAKWLADKLPETTRTSLVHGDYRLDNVLVRKDNREITAVLDWEMATRGDPLADLGVLQVYWNGLGGGGADDDGSDDPITGGVTKGEGFLTFDQLAARYAERTGADIDNLDWYLAFAYFKLAVVLEGIYYRYSHGETVGEGFESMGPLVPRLVDAGLAARG